MFPLQWRQQYELQYNKLTCLMFPLQYVNSSYEHLTGYSLDEVVGKDSRELRSDRNKPEMQDAINSQMKKGKVRKGGSKLRTYRGCHYSVIIWGWNYSVIVLGL